MNKAGTKGGLALSMNKLNFLKTAAFMHNFEHVVLKQLRLNCLACSNKKYQIIIEIAVC